MHVVHVPSSGKSINLNCSTFDKLVQARKDASEKMAQEAMSLETKDDQSKVTKKRRVSEDAKDLLCEDHVDVMTGLGKSMSFLWSITSSELWVELNELWLD